MPWEITLPSDIIAHPLFSKAGSHPGHTSHLLISPDLSFAVIAFACGPRTNAGTLAFEAERVVTPLMQQVVGERAIMAYAGIYQQDCPKKCSECGEIVVEVDAELRITRAMDCDGKDIFSKFDVKCETQECFAKLWTTGRQGEFRYINLGWVDSRATILGKETGCDTNWFGFEPAVVNGWPIDLIRVSDDRLVYRPLGIDAKRVPMEDEVTSR
jgi:hypothetical protein